MFYTIWTFNMNCLRMIIDNFVACFFGIKGHRRAALWEGNIDETLGDY